VSAALTARATQVSDAVGRPHAWSKACGVCRRTYDAGQWPRLPSVAMLPVQSVQAHLSVPAAWTVELRQCACGAVLAARV